MQDHDVTVLAVDNPEIHLYLAHYCPCRYLLRRLSGLGRGLGLEVGCCVRVEQGDPCSLMLHYFEAGSRVGSSCYFRCRLGTIVQKSMLDYGPRSRLGLDYGVGLAEASCSLDFRTYSLVLYDFFSRLLVESLEFFATYKSW